MGDTPARPMGDPSNMSQSSRRDAAQLSRPGPHEGEDARKSQQGTSSQNTTHVGHIPGQQYFPQQQNLQTRPEPFNLGPLSAALPDPSYQNYGQPQRYPSASQSSGIIYQMQNPPQFGGPQAMSPTNAPYPYQAQYQSIYATGNSPSPPHLQQGPAMGNQFYQGFIGQQQQLGTPPFIQPSHYSQMYSGMPQPQQYGPRGGYSADSQIPQQQRPNEYLGVISPTGGSGMPSRIGSSSGQSTVVRGPPRKPRQSGHAIWIGNLPPQTELMNLVHHVYKEAPGLESLFLISKSNCAFANFKDETTCAAAQAKIHDSRFQNVRLVSRLRRRSVGTTTGVPAPTGPAALTPPNPAPDRTPSPESGSKPKEVGGEVNEQDSEDSPSPKDKFFVVKSLTVEDLELSVRNGIWATQSHNEEILNKAYQTADNVYLIFSANKSGEYFGYARMISPINDDPAAAIEFAPKAQTVEDPELPKAIPTPATEFVPKGRIIDDSARGTIFWEVERDEEDEEDETQSNKSDTDLESPLNSKAWGKPFKVEWLSTTRLPFYRTRGLRNPWNSNREVKIARDGTELETSVGRKLIGLFHRIPSAVAQPVSQMQGMLTPLAGYPPMRPFQ